jgi:hypothetical protein
MGLFERSSELRQVSGLGGTEVIYQRIDVEDTECFGNKSREFRHVQLAQLYISIRVLWAYEELPEWIRGYSKPGARFAWEVQRWGRGGDT